MNKTFITAACAALLAIGGLAFVAGAADDAKKTNDTKSTATSAPTSQPVNKYCAVEKDNEVSAKGGTYVYNGKTIGFCCEDCIDTFKKDPDKYMKDLK
jgi:YHS domain-containing protein